MLYLLGFCQLSLFRFLFLLSFFELGRHRSSFAGCKSGRFPAHLFLSSLLHCLFEERFAYVADGSLVPSFRRFLYEVDSFGVVMVDSLWTALESGRNPGGIRYEARGFYTTRGDPIQFLDGYCPALS